jgi:hypothetical protein
LNRTESSTCSRTGVSTVSLVAVVNDGGRSSDRPVILPSSTPPLLMKITHSTSVGAAMANSFSQYWNACTTVIARMPPPNTLTITTTATIVAPSHDGVPGRMLFSARPAACSCGTTYRIPMNTTNTAASPRRPREPRRASQKSGSV